MIRMSVGFHASHNPTCMLGQKIKNHYDWWNGHRTIKKPKKHWLVLELSARIHNIHICTSVMDNPIANTCGYLSSVYWPWHAKQKFE